MKCINCGNEIQDGLVTCPFCNANLNNQVPVTPSAPVLPQDQNMVVTPEAPVIESNNEPIAQVQDIQNQNGVPETEKVMPMGVTNDNSNVVESVAAVNPLESTVAPQNQSVEVQQPQAMPPLTSQNVEVQQQMESVSQASVVQAPTTSETPTPQASVVQEQQGNVVLETTSGVQVSAAVTPSTNIPPTPPTEIQSGERIGNSAPVIEKKSNKKRNKIIIIILAILLVLVGIVVFIYFYEFKSADKRIEVISKNLFSFTKRIKNDSVELSSGKYNISGGITSGEENISVDANGTYAIDLKNQILDLTLNAKSIKVGEELLPEPLNVELYLNDSKAYLLLQNFYDKYIYTEYPQMKEMFDTLSENDINYVALIRGVENAISVSMKGANSTQTVEDVKINGKTQKVNVIRIVSTAANQKIISTKFFRTLASNTAFVKEYAKLNEMTESEAKEDLLSNLEDVTYENDPNTKIEIYSPLVGNSVLGIKLSGKEEESGEILIIEIYPIANGYGFNVTTNGKSILKGQLDSSIKKTSKTENISINVSVTAFDEEATSKIDLKINVENDVNPKVEKVNVKNSVDYRYIPVADQQAIASKIANYGDLGMYLSQYLNLTGFGSNSETITNSCLYAFNCTPTGDGINNTCQVCSDSTQTCLTPSTITCPIG